MTIDDHLVLPRRLDYGQYDRLWSHLRKLPVMQGKSFPPRTDKAIWDVLLQDTRLTSRGITMSGYFQFMLDGPIFQLRLRPLQLDNSHRLERRFGAERFLEIDMPNITGTKVPKTLRDLNSVGKAVIVKWLTDQHKFIGKTWTVFCNKPIRTKGKPKNKGLETKSELDNSLTQRLFFFAVTGDGFKPCKGTPLPGSTQDSWTADGLLNWIRPTSENRSQPYLKLYARTSLSLSRNNPTIVIPWDQILYKEDMMFAGEAMTDGAGRLSFALAQKIANHLGLDSLPSGFQARFGDAKGFWTIDPDTINYPDEWIEVYESQQKWTRKDVNDPHYEDPAYRTFEVNGKSGELKSADLNTQLLPILVDRAIDKTEMINVIGQLLEQNLAETINSQRDAMMNPLTCMEWVQDTNCRLTEKLKTGVVPFAGGLPALSGDRMSVLLGAGFHPVTCKLLRELAQRLYSQKCDDLRNELKITVHRSTYAYMVPDFSGVLEPDEVYIHLSKNISPPGKLVRIKVILFVISENRVDYFSALRAM